MSRRQMLDLATELALAADGVAGRESVSDLHTDELGASFSVEFGNVTFTVLVEEALDDDDDDEPYNGGVREWRHP